ncbi:MAG: hypothetical protein K8I02_04590, partial [Candidatus Methylomirabilis sp.]|nr:hypothetical protein [Deltaproteobacteria bacterium]
MDGAEYKHVVLSLISEVSRGEVRRIQRNARGEEPSRARRRLRHGDTVLSTVRPDRGSYFLCIEPDDHLVASTGFAVLTAERVPWSFAYCAATQPSTFEYLGQVADGGAYPAVRPDVIESLPVTLPPTSELLSILHDLCRPLLERAHLARLHSRTLAALHDALLPKLLSGEIRVPEAERMLEAAGV